MNTLENAFLQFIDSFLYSSQQVKMGKNYFYEKIWGNHATSVSDGLSGRIVAVSGSDPGSTFRYPGSIEVRLFDIRHFIFHDSDFINERASALVG